MSKRLSVGITSLLVLVLSAVAAFAHVPTITITSPTQGQVIEVSSFPATIPVAGTITHVNTTPTAIHQQNLCSLNNSTEHKFTVSVSSDEGATWTAIGSEEFSESTGTQCASLYNWSYNFSALDEGEYLVRARARHGSDTGEANSDFAVEFNLVVARPAAPSVAGALLKDADVSARYGTGRNGGNCIADVAHAMGPGASFDGVPKSDVNDYRDAVRDFLNGGTVNGVSANPACSLRS